MAHWQIIPAVIALGFGPGLFWLLYFYRKDEIEPEPLAMIRLTFFLGVVAILPAIVIETAIPAPPIVSMAIEAPIVEEILKFLVVYIAVYRNVEFDEPMDGIIYASSAALGFASMENALYLATEFYKPQGQPLITAVLRAFLSVPGHALMSILWGYALGRAKFEPKNKAMGIIAVGLIFSILAHGGFNFILNLGPYWIVAMLALVPFMWGPIHARIEAAHLMSPHHDLSGAEYPAPPTYKRAEIVNPRWFDNRIIAAILLFAVFPVGLYAIYKNSRFSMPEKLAIISLWIAATGILTVNYSG
jgi:RsiW-degrading membrane proteinase PrsW (M82 family)